MSELRHLGGESGRLRVRAFGRPYAPFHDPYQRYYTESLRRYCASADGDFRAIPMTRFVRLLEGLKRVRDEGWARRLRMPLGERAIDALARLLEGRVVTPSGHFHNVTGQYLARLPGGEPRRFAVDAQDSHEIASEELRAWSDVYFKTNYWAGGGYAPNVRPLVNGDPFVLSQIEELRALRSAPKRFDLSFVVRVWGGADEIEGIEHTLRLLEAVARVRCTARILAIVVAGDVSSIRRRLERSGISSTTRAIRADDLWRLGAESRLSIFRLGLHYCIPWRMTGSLAIGACAVLDRPPFSVWPEPLREEVNYLSLDTMVGPGCPVAPDEQYAAVSGRIEDWLSRDALPAEIGRANAAYFDAHLDPVRVGEHMVATLSRPD